MIAPALISTSDSQSQETSIVSADNHSQTIAYFLFEENSSEEEEIAFEFIEAPPLVFPKEFRQTSWIESHEVTPSRPPLFTLFHTYII